MEQILVRIKGDETDFVRATGKADQAQAKFGKGFAALKASLVTAVPVMVNSYKEIAEGVGRWEEAERELAQSVTADVTVMTDQFEQGFRKVDLAAAETIRGVTYFYAEASTKALTFEDTLKIITHGILRLQTIGKQTGDVLYDALGKFADDVIAPWKIELDKSASAFKKFGANIANGMVQLVAKVITQGLLYAGFIELLNLLPPPGVIGTGFAKLLAGGMAWKDIFSGGKPGVPAGIPGKQAGGRVGKRPYFVGERGPELFVPQAPGEIISNDALNRLASVMRPPQAPANALQTVVNVNFEGDVGEFLSAFVNICRDAPAQVRREFGHEVIDVKDLEESV
jgi:hypothetical protein